MKGKVLSCSLPSGGPGADPGVQTVSLQVTFLSHPSGRLPLLSARPAVTFTVKERHCPSTSIRLYCSVIEAHGCEQLVQGCYAALFQWELNPRPIDRKSNALPLHYCATERQS